MGMQLRETMRPLSDDEAFELVELGESLLNQRSYSPDADLHRGHGAGCERFGGARRGQRFRPGSAGDSPGTRCAHSSPASSPAG